MRHPDLRLSSVADLPHIMPAMTRIFRALQGLEGEEVDDRKLGLPLPLLLTTIMRNVSGFLSFRIVAT